ncbi:MAG: MerR family transcriptional regulator [Muribaculaceae bacterium]|nr:MerR family transcriptional regulator [Muribaculaceae bacterium]
MDNIEKKYYKIREVAEIIGLPASTLRFWENKFKIIKPHRNEHGTRFYTPSDIENIRLVAFLVKEKGMKLESAEQQIRQNHSGISRKVEAIENLKQIRLKLKTMLDALNSRRPNKPQ